MRASGFATTVIGRGNYLVIMIQTTKIWVGEFCANLIIHPKIWDISYEGKKHEEGLIDNPHSKPTEKELTDALAKQQSDFDAQEYARERAAAYPSTGDQLDMMYKDTKNSTTTHAAAVEAVKTKWPKDNSGPV